MAVIVASSSRSADALISYALDDKPDQKGERYVMASGTGGLLVSVARHQMRDVRKKWGKDKPGAFVQAYHVIESFGRDELDPEDPDAWMTAQVLGRALAEDRFPGRHVLVVTQRDGKTGCLHNHLVVNSIETKTGRSLNSSIVTHARLVEAHERVLEEHGFEQRADLRQAFSDAQERMERGQSSGLRRADSSERSEEREYQRYILWETECDIADDLGMPRNPEPFSLTVLRVYIERALADPAAVDWDSFVAAGRRHHVRIEQRGKKGRGISYGMLREQPDGTLAEPSAHDRRRCSTLGPSFEMGAVEHAFARNSNALHAQQSTPATAPTAPVVAATPAVDASADASAKIRAHVDRMRAMLDDIQAEANARVEKAINELRSAKAAASNSSSEASAHPEPTASGVPETSAPPTVVDPVAPESGDGEFATLDAASATTRITPAEPLTTSLSSTEEEVDRRRHINARNRRLGLPLLPSGEPSKQSATAKRRRPELFGEDDPQSMEPDGREFGD